MPDKTISPDIQIWNAALVAAAKQFRGPKAAYTIGYMSPWYIRRLIFSLKKKPAPITGNGATMHKG